MTNRISPHLYLLLVCTLLSACAHLPPNPTPSERADWGKLVIVPARFPPQSNLRAFASRAHRAI